MLPTLRPVGYATCLFATLALAASGCGHKTKGGSDPATTVVDDGNPSQAGDSADPTTASAPPASPAAADVGSNAQTQALVASAGLDAAASGAAAGTSGAGSSAGLLDSSQPSETVKTGSDTQSCYSPAHVQTARLDGLAWPESTDTASIFADSKNDANDTTDATMYVEPTLVEYPVTGTPAATLTLSTKFAFADMVEVVEKDTRQTDVTLADLAHTTVSAQTNDEQHRFWVAKSGPLACVGSTAAPKGDSKDADGRWAKIKWTDVDGTVNGLNLLERFARSGTSAHSYLPKKHGKYATTPVTIASNTGATGYRLVQFSTSKTAASTVAGATVAVTKTITHSFSSVRQVVDAKGNVTSDVSGLDEVRATSPLVVTDFRDAGEKPLQHVVASGSVLHTGKDKTGAVKFFTKFDFSNVTFDRVHSTEPCLPVSGSVTMTTYASEGGAQVKQVTITYSSTATAGGTAGQVDPSLTVSGDDANGTQAQWMMLHVNRRCDLKS